MLANYKFLREDSRIFECRFTAVLPTHITLLNLTKTQQNPHIMLNKTVCEYSQVYFQFDIEGHKKL